MLLKVSEKILPGIAIIHLGRTKIRTPEGFITILDKKHLINVFLIMGYSKTSPPRDVATPGVKRAIATDESGDALLSPTDKTQ